MILQTAIEHYGVEIQLNKVQEELGKLITAISKWRNKDVFLIEVVDEIVDAEIMIAQLKLILEKIYEIEISEDIEKRTEYKLERLKQRIEDDNDKSRLIQKD